MINFKNTIFLLLYIVFLTACGKKGCSDKNALNYDEKVQSKNDDGSCEYNGNVVFWRNNDPTQSTCAFSLEVENINAKFFFNPRIYYSTPPECLTRGPVNIHFAQGIYNYKVQNLCTYEIKDSTFLIKPNECTSVFIEF